MPQSLKTFSRWLTPWLHKVRPAPTALPLSLSPQELEAIRHLRSTPQWRHYLLALERVAEHQANVLASAGLDHDKYLFTCGALTALRRIYTLADDLVAAAANLKEIEDDRTRATVRAEQRRASTYVNTPFYDGWRRDAERAR